MFYLLDIDITVGLIGARQHFKTVLENAGVRGGYIRRRKFSLQEAVEIVVPMAHVEKTKRVLAENQSNSSHPLWQYKRMNVSADARTNFSTCTDGDDMTIKKSFATTYKGTKSQ